MRPSKGRGSFRFVCMGSVKTPGETHGHCGGGGTPNFFRVFVGQKYVTGIGTNMVQRTEPGWAPWDFHLKKSGWGKRRNMPRMREGPGA